eukprot:COSAG02_NODE_548_length_20472_cov_5.958524_12_plen_134_part_00
MVVWEITIEGNGAPTPPPSMVREVSHGVHRGTENALRNIVTPFGPAGDRCLFRLSLSKLGVFLTMASWTAGKMSEPRGTHADETAGNYRSFGPKGTLNVSIPERLDQVSIPLEDPTGNPYRYCFGRFLEPIYM